MILSKNKTRFSLTGDVRSFLGNQTHKDHFKLLQMDGSSILIGARNVIYNLSIEDLSENAEQVSLNSQFVCPILQYDECDFVSSRIQSSSLSACKPHTLLCKGERLVSLTFIKVRNVIK